MEFFFRFILISSSLSLYWAYPYDDPNIPEPSLLLSYPYSILHIQPPKSDVPNIACPMLETPFVEYGKSDPSTSLTKRLYSKMENILCAYEYDSRLLRLSIYEHLLCYKFTPEDRGNDTEHLPARLYNDTSSPILNGNLNCLLNVNFDDLMTLNKSITFIETKVTAMKLQGFNL